MNSRHFLKRTLVLALPVAIQTLLQAMLGMADVSMVSGLGEIAVASVGLASKLHFLTLVLMMGIATAGSSLIAQFKGAANPTGVERTLGVTLAIGLLINSPLMLIFFGAKAWIGLVTPDTGVAGFTAEFLIITAPVLVFTQVTVIFESGLRSLGQTSLPLIIGLFTVLLNIVFNFIFIFGHLGFEPMGVLGAAWGTLLARMIQCAAIVGWLYLSRHAFALPLQKYRAIVSLRELKRFAKFSAPLVMNYGLWGLGNTTYHLLMGYAGTEALAVMGVMVPVETAFFATFWGISSACAVMIGQALGADNLEEARALQKYFSRLSIITAISLSIILFFLKPVIVPLFSQLSGDALAMLSDAINVFCLVVTIKVMNMLNIVGVLRAGGDNHYCLKVDTIVMWLIGLPVFALAVIVDTAFIYLYFLLALEDIAKFTPFLKRIKKGVWVRNLTVNNT